MHATIDNFATGDCPPLDQLVASARPTLFDDAVQMERENATLSLGAASDALVTNAAAGVLYAAVRDAEQEAIEEGMTGRAIACAVAVAAIWILLLIRLLSHAVFTPWLEISFAICSTIVLWGFALRGQRAVFSQSQISRIASQLAEWGIGDDGVDGAMTRMRRDPFGKASWIDVPRLKRQLRGELTARAARKPTYPSA